MDALKSLKERELERIPSIVSNANSPPHMPSPHSSMLNQASAFRNVLAGTAGLMLGLSPSPPSRTASLDRRPIPKEISVALPISRGNSSQGDSPMSSSTVHETTSCKKLLDPNQREEYNRMRGVYAEYLFSLGLLEKRAEVLQYIDVIPVPHQGLEIRRECRECADKAGICSDGCRVDSTRCVICREVCRGLIWVCIGCGHGGCVCCVRGWFGEEEGGCASGCGCFCVFNNTF
jgi:hypothetical protein